MIKIPQEALEELKVLFEKNYGIKLTETQIEEEAKDLLYIYAFSQGELHLLNHFIDK
ncbi:hypothetical protein ACQY1Q_15985 [Tenacibaculum sp. TC6]|uniref:hypothetical protein n=1 Tax=Tenacibaculum sp. TC6 TaxID=3423223 RepID=UPI003D3671C6